MRNAGRFDTYIAKWRNLGNGVGFCTDYVPFRYRKDRLGCSCCAAVRTHYVRTTYVRTGCARVAAAAGKDIFIKKIAKTQNYKLGNFYDTKTTLLAT